ncbi:DUF397 domain-containing protein [Streptomyces sp. AV19]|uniref:DUF397 domain-containing protein n=1 Tax=Streptomyces sp. AV19 TaxID=2793068 RepID=UPI00322147E9
MDVRWRKSSFSEHPDGNCVEIAPSGISHDTGERRAGHNRQNDRSRAGHAPYKRQGRRARRRHAVTAALTAPSRCPRWVKRRCAVPNSERSPLGL